MIEFATPIEHEVDYDHAYLYCITLTLHNKYNWRMPTLSEFRYSSQIPAGSWFEYPKGGPAYATRPTITPVRDL